MYLSVCGLESPCSSFVTYRQVIQLCATSAFFIVVSYLYIVFIIFTQFTGVWAREQQWLNYLKDIIKQSITSTSLLRSVPVRCQCQYYTHCCISLLRLYWLTRLVSEFRMKREPTLPMMEEERIKDSLYNTEILVRKLICLFPP